MSVTFDILNWIIYILSNLLDIISRIVQSLKENYVICEEKNVHKVKLINSGVFQLTLSTERTER